MSETPELKEKLELVINENDIIKEIVTEYDMLYDMLNYDEYSIKERLEKNPYWYQQFRLLWIKEKAKLLTIKDLADAYTGRLYHRLRFENTIALGKIEAEKYYIPKDDQYREFQKRVRNQEIRVETFDAIKDAFKQQGFSMNTFVKNLEL